MSADTTSARTVSIEAMGVLVDVEVADPGLAAAVTHAWRDALVEAADDDPRHRVRLRAALTGAGSHTGAGAHTGAGSHTGTADVTGEDTAEVLHRLSPAVTLTALDARAGDLVLLHAAALADPATGATVVLVAASGTGKTTASQVLGADLAYLSDETAAITEDGEVLPYRKPLSIVGETHLKAQVPASERGLRLDEVASPRLAALLMLERSPDHEGPVEIEDVATVDGLALLAPQASALARTVRPLHRLADVITAAGGLRVVRYREAADLVPVVAALLESAPVESTPVESTP